MKNAKYLILAIVFGVALVGVPVIAQTQQSTQNESQRSFEQRLEEKQQAKEERLADRQARQCERVAIRLETLSEKYEFIGERRANAYQSVSDTLTALALRLENNDQPATEINGIAVEFSDLIAEFEVAQARLEAAITNASNISCSDEYKQELQVVRTALRTVRQQSAVIRSYVSDDVKPALVTLKDSLVAGNGEEN